jgi:hypothetical protein
MRRRRHSLRCAYRATRAYATPLCHALQACSWLMDTLWIFPWAAALPRNSPVDLHISRPRLLALTHTDASALLLRPHCIKGGWAKWHWVRRLSKHCLSLIAKSITMTIRVSIRNVGNYSPNWHVVTYHTHTVPFTHAVKPSVVQRSTSLGLILQHRL